MNSSIHVLYHNIVLFS